jgi:hypothetical protein
MSRGKSWNTHERFHFEYINNQDNSAVRKGDIRQSACPFLFGQFFFLGRNDFKILYYAGMCDELGTSHFSLLFLHS